MKLETLCLENGSWAVERAGGFEGTSAALVMVFGDTDTMEREACHAGLKARYPNARIVGLSTAGNILGPSVRDSEAVATAVMFDGGRVEVVTSETPDNETLEAVSRQLIEALPQEGLKHVFVMFGGITLNGSAIATGVNSVNKSLCITGGLAGDGFRFDHCVVMCDGPARQSLAAAVGFYGDGFRIQIGCKGGWDEFGAERTVTRSEGNVVYEIDDKPAITLYEAYLGEYITDLPASGLLFPLSVKERGDDKEVIRVMMAVNGDGSITFAGDVPQNATVRLMKTNVNNMIDGAETVARTIRVPDDTAALALTVSCSGRRAVLGQLVDAELEAVQTVLGANVQMAGFYSYGELAPFSDRLGDCKLHNETMTMTVIYED